MKKVIAVILILSMLCTLAPITQANEPMRLDVPTFVQHFEPWKDQQYGFGSRTIEYAGCALTCLAMVLKYYGINTDPGELNTWLKNNGGYSGTESINWSKVSQKSNGTVYCKGSAIIYGSQDLWRINTEIDNGNPVIARMNYQGTSHYVVICGYNGNQYYINDPWTENSSKTINEGYEPKNNPGAAIQEIITFGSSNKTHPKVPVVPVAVSKFSEPIKDDYLPVVSFGDISLTINDPYMTVSGQKKLIDPEGRTAPIIINNRTFLPVRAIIEAMGGTVTWEGKAKKVEIVIAKRTIEMWVNKRQAFINGYPFTLEVAPCIVNSRVMLPIRPIIEKLNCKISWNPSTKTVYITSDAASRGGSSAQQGRPEDKIIFNDSALEKAIRATLRKPTGDVYYTDFNNMQITEVWYTGLGIKDISALKGAVNLKGLYLSNNNIKDISALANLKNLTKLDLSQNQITDVSPLKDLKNLTELNLNDNPVTNPTVLKNLTSLKTLRIYGKTITDMKQIDSLSLSDSMINFTDKNLEQYLRQVVGKSTGTVYYGDFERKSIDKLWIVSKEVSDISALKGFIHLKVLSLVDNNISDCSAVQNLTNLTELYLSKNNISDISMIKNLKKLEIFEAHNNNITDVSVLLDLPNLKSVNIRYNPIKDKSVIQTLISRGVNVTY